MQFSVPSPCHNCPFLRVGGVRLTQARVREVAGNMLSRNGGSFPCHKHVHHDMDDDGNSRAINANEAPHCAGALIFAEKNGNETWVMQIAGRLGLYDRAKLMRNKRAVARVFDGLREMLAVNRKAIGR